MKRLLIITALLAGFSNVKAQSVAGTTHSHWEENDNAHHKTKVAPANEFINTEMSVDNNTVTFSGLPEMKKAACAVITNADGEFVRQAKITPEQNTMDIKRLHSGLYFVTILYRDESKKAFTLNL